jgi:tRNA-dihydrouridine synthase B
VASAVENAGARALTVHGRTAEQMYRGTADWEAIGKIRDQLQHIPLIGNGDLTTARQAIDTLGHYPVDGIMIGRGGMNRPSIFREIASFLHGEVPPREPSLEEQRHWLLRYHQLMKEQFGPENAVRRSRRFACAYVHGKPGARKFRRTICRIKTEGELRELIDRFFRALPSSSSLF